MSTTARFSDPETSRSAQPANTGQCRLEVLEILSAEALPDHELVTLITRFSPSSVRTRRHELVEAGLVVDTGRRVLTPAGRMSIVWAATPKPQPLVEVLLWDREVAS